MTESSVMRPGRGVMVDTLKEEIEKTKEIEIMSSCFLYGIKIYCPIKNRKRLVASCDISDNECMCIEKLNLSYSKKAIKTAYVKLEKKYRHKNFPKTLKDFITFINNNMRDQTFSMSTSYIWKDYRDFLKDRGVQLY